MVLAIGNGLGLAMVQFVYVARRVIPPIHSIDAFVELSCFGSGGFSGLCSLDGNPKSLTAVISTIEVVLQTLPWIYPGNSQRAIEVVDSANAG